MALIASFVVGSNGATTVGSLSRPLSTPADRARFLTRHRSAGAFIIGKKSAQLENYSSSEVPIFVLTRKSDALSFPHPLMQQVTIRDGELHSIARKIDQRIDGDVIIEAGVTLLTAMIDAGAVDLLELTLSPVAGDGNFVEVEDILAKFEYTEAAAADGTRLLECRYKGDAANS